MSTRDRVTKKPTNIGMNVDPYNIEVEGSGLRLRYGIPLWLAFLMAIMILILVAVTLWVAVYHNQHDKDAYVCNDSDRDRWYCPLQFDPDTDDCDELPYKEEAEGGDFQMCYLNECLYFKEWIWDPFPCFGDETFPEISRQHCLDMIEDSYPHLERLEVILFCTDIDDTVELTCIYHDKCSKYGFDDTDLDDASSSASSLALKKNGARVNNAKSNAKTKKITVSGNLKNPSISLSSNPPQNGTDPTNGLNLYIYGSRMVYKDKMNKANGGSGGKRVSNDLS